MSGDPWVADDLKTRLKSHNGRVTRKASSADDSFLEQAVCFACTGSL